MKLFIRLLLFISIHCQSQNITELFLNFPKEYSDGLNVIQKKQLIKEKRMTIDDMDYHLTLDTKNGYLRMEQSYNGGQSGYQIFEICYWNYKNSKLIAYSSISGSNGGFFQNDFKFFDYNKGNIVLKNYGTFPNYTSNIDILMNNIVNELVIDGLNQEKKGAIRYAGLIVHLPQKGKNIYITFQDESLIEEFYSNYINKTELILNWNYDGTFH